MSTEQMMRLVSVVGRELSGAASGELAIGNTVKRVLYMIREEYSAKIRSLEIMSRKQSESSFPPTTSTEPLSLATNVSEMSLNSLNSNDEDGEQDQGVDENDDEFVIGEDLTMLEGAHHTSHSTHKVVKHTSIKRAGSTSPHIGDLMPGRELSQVDLTDLAQQPSLHGLISRARDSEADFSK
jgi:hypothetical protein